MKTFSIDDRDVQTFAQLVTKIHSEMVKFSNNPISEEKVANPIQGKTCPCS